MIRNCDTLKPHKWNSVIFGDEPLDQAFAASVKESGVLVPLTIKADGTILSGHRRWYAAIVAGLIDVPVKVEEYANEEQERRAFVNYNRQREKTFSQKMREAEFVEETERIAAKRRQGMRTDIVDLGPQCEQGKSRDKVAEQIGIGSGRQYDRAKKVWAAAEAGDEDAVKAVKGIDQGSITIKVAYTQVQKIERQAQKREQQKVAEEVAEIQAKTSIQVTRGRFYKLGDHVLYCGDTSDIEFISRTPEAKFAFADPPYNAHVADWDIDFEWKHDWLANKSDITVVTPGTTSIFDFARITAMPYKWSIACFIKNGMARGALGFSNWIYAALFSAGSVFINSQDILEVVLKTSENNETEHRGRKPTEFIVWLIEKFTREGDMVIDPFLGSGTTLLACEATGRRCFGGEINPEFCQEIIGRWETLSGQKAEEVVING